jgi:hypothetical protein
MGFLGEVSLALSTDIIFPYKHIALQSQDASDKLREVRGIRGPLFLRSDKDPLKGASNLTTMARRLLAGLHERAASVSFS